MSELVPHPGDVAPRDVGFGGEDLGAGVLDRLTDLDEADPNGAKTTPSSRSPRPRWDKIASAAAGCPGTARAQREVMPADGDLTRLG